MPNIKIFTDKDHTKKANLLEVNVSNILNPDGSSFETRLTDIESKANRIDTKANQSDLANINTDIAGLEEMIHDNIDNIALKADQTDLDTTNANIVANAEALKLKANQADLDMTNKNIATNAEALKLKAKQSDLDAANANISTNAEAIKLKANQTDLQEVISNVAVNTENINSKANQTDLELANDSISTLNRKTAESEEQIGLLSNEVGNLNNTIFTESANMFDKNSVRDGFTSPDGTSSSVATFKRIDIPIVGGKSYTFSNDRILTCFYDSNNAVVVGGEDHESTYTLTAPNNATSVVVSCKTEAIGTIMVNEGTEALPYDDYGAKHSVCATKNDIIITNILSVTPTTYRQVLESIKDSSYNNRYRLLLEPGTYDIWSMMTSTEQSDATFKGFYTPKFVSLVGNGTTDNIIITCDSPSINGKLSPVNLDVLASVENITVTANNCRYAIHDDWQERKWYDNETIENYWSEPFQKGFVRICKNVITKITNGYVGASWGCGVVDGAEWINENCIIGKGSEFSYICHNDNQIVKSANVTLRNCRCGDGKIRFSSLNKGQNASCHAHIIGTQSSGIALTEEEASTFGTGIRWTLDGYANNFNSDGVTITNTDGVDYSQNISII